MEKRFSRGREYDQSILYIYTDGSKWTAARDGVYFENFDIFLSVRLLKSAITSAQRRTVKFYKYKLPIHRQPGGICSLVVPKISFQRGQQIQEGFKLHGRSTSLVHILGPRSQENFWHEKDVAFLNSIIQFSLGTIKGRSIHKLNIQFRQRSRYGQYMTRQELRTY